MVLYRKYRPQTLDDLIGQEQVKLTLLNSLKNQKLAHAYLFCGPRGTGKTSTARILAKMVNCTDKVSPGCGKCQSCLSISDGTSLDLIEVDAASNRGIDDIRALRDNIKLSPSSSLKKVYIIDEVHMLTTESFNALLKTLEEPPSHVLFILATTDPQKVPATILSRVSRLDFKLASIEDLKIAFKKILESEKVEADDEALNLLARYAQGSFRDGVKLLDQVASSGKVSVLEIEKILSSSSFDGIKKVLEKVAECDGKGALNEFSVLMTDGASTKELNLSILEILRDLIMVKYDLTGELLKGKYLENQLKQLLELSSKFETDKLIRALDAFTKSIERARYIMIPTLPLEIALVESCQKDLVNTQPQITNAVSNEVKAVIPEVSLPSITFANADLATAPVITINDDVVSGDIQKIQDKWGYILETTRAYNYSLEALLRSAKIVKCDDRVVTVEVPYSFHQRMMEAPKSRDLLESVLSDILGRSITVSTVLGQRPQRREDIQNVEIAPDDEIVRLASEIFSSDAVN